MKHHKHENSCAVCGDTISEHSTICDDCRKERMERISIDDMEYKDTMPIVNGVDP